MKESRTQKKADREKAFAKLGEVDYEEKAVKPGPKKIESTKKIYFDERQYSAKLPIDILDGYWKEGDSLKFTRTTHPNGKVEIKVEYVKGKK